MCNTQQMSIEGDPAAAQGANVLMGEAHSRLIELMRMHYLLVVYYYSHFPVLRILHILTTTPSGSISSKSSPNMEFPKLMSDGGLQFDFEEFRKQWCFIHILASSRYPQLIGPVE